MESMEEGYSNGSHHFCNADIEWDGFICCLACVDVPVAMISGWQLLHMQGSRVNCTGCKIGNALIQHVLCKQESGLTKILSHLPQYIFFRFKNQRMRGNMLPFNPQV